jgi:putrescine transport system substrate-binding protein
MALRYSAACFFRRDVMYRYCIAGILALSIAGCGDAPDSVHVFNWSDYIAADVLRQFQQETGIRVVYDVYDSNEMLETRLLAGRSGYDVVFPTARPYAARHLQSGIYAPLDDAQLSNLGNLDTEILRSLHDIDPGNEHVLPYTWGTTGLGYNRHALERRLGDGFDPASWNLLFDPDIAARLADCGIAILDDPEEALHAVLLWLGRDGSSADANDLRAAVEAFRGVRPHVRYFHSSQYINDLANGDVCLALGYSGDVLQARERAAEANAAIEVEYAVPREGALMWVDVMAIPRDAPHPEAAHRFIDFLMRPEVMATITNYVWYANANTASLPYVDEEIRSDPAIYPDAETRARFHRARTLTPEERRQRTRAFERIKTGH